MYNNSDYSVFRALRLEFSCVLPYVASGGFYPEFDVAGSELQRLGRGVKNDHMSINVTVIRNRTVAVLGWLGDQGPATALATSLEGVTASKSADVLFKLTLNHIENIFFRPSWWDNLSAALKTSAMRES
jgi:hypothetical protein